MAEKLPLEFWHGLNMPAECPTCGYIANGTVFKWLLLEGPQDFTCNKCSGQWSVCANELGKAKTHELLIAYDEYNELSEKIHALRQFLHGKGPSPYG